MKTIIWGLGVLAMTACSPSELEPIEYVNWMEDPENEVCQIYSQNELSLECQYMTPEYSALSHSDPNNIDVQWIESQSNQLSDIQQFRLRFKRDGQSNFLRDDYTTNLEYNSKTLYLGYEIQHDLMLIQNDDTLPCIMNHHERTYGNTPYETLLVAFEGSTVSGDTEMDLILNDRVLGFGRVKFHYDQSLLVSLPELKL